MPKQIKSKEITISLIIPIFNVEEYLSDCLNSVLYQDNKLLEVILVDDHSTDKSCEIANQYTNQFHHCQLISHKSNKGLGPARNSGIEVASGEYIMMLDSDDWLEESAISNVMRCINEGKFDLAHFGCNKIHKNKEELNLYIHTSDCKEILDHQSWLLMRPKYVWLKTYRTKFIRNNRLFFSDTYYEDIPWTIKTILLAKDIKLFPYTTYNYRLRSESITSTKSSKHLDLISGYQEIYSSSIYKPLNWRLKRALGNDFIESSYFLHRKRTQRLHLVDVQLFWKSFFNTLYKNKIFPSKLRTLTMLALITMNAASSKLCLHMNNKHNHTS